MFLLFFLSDINISLGLVQVEGQGAILEPVWCPPWIQILNKLFSVHENYLYTTTSNINVDSSWVSALNLVHLRISDTTVVSYNSNFRQWQRGP